MATPTPDDLDALADRIGNDLIRLQRIRERTIAHSKASVGIDPAAYACLYRLINAGPMRSSALAEALYADPSTVSRQVAQLVERGHVERQPDPTDGRASVLAVTDSGREAGVRIRALRNAKLGQVLTDWPVDDLHDFTRLLDRFVEDYERVRPLFDRPRDAQ